MRFRLLVDDRLMALIKVDGFNQECTRIEAKIQIPSLSATLPQPLHVLQPKAASGALSFVSSVLRPWPVRHPHHPSPQGDGRNEPRNYCGSRRTTYNAQRITHRG